MRFLVQWIASEKVGKTRLVNHERGRRIRAVRFARWKNHPYARLITDEPRLQLIYYRAFTALKNFGERCDALVRCYRMDHP